MAVKIRLRQQGRTHSPFYRLVATDSRNPRDGRYIEVLGWYNPQESDAERNLLVKPDRVKHWLDQGAILTENAEALVKKAAPEVIKERTEREIANRIKRNAKRKERKKAATA